MDPTLFLLSLAGIFIIGAVGEIIFQKTNIPDVVWLIFAGIAIGPVLGLVKPESLNAIAPYFAAITLVVVLFDGGSALKLGELRRAAPRSALLAILSFVASVGAVAAATMAAATLDLLPNSWTWTHGLLTGTIVGGSSSIIIMPALSRANLRPKLANLINLESALTDALCVVTTTALIDVMAQGGDGGAAAPAIALAKSFGIGLGIGAVVGFFWILFLKLLRNNEHAYPITLSVLLLLYVGIDYLGGSAALGILTVAIILGNAPSLSKTIGLAHQAELDTEVRGFHKQMTFIVKSFFFVFIGAMLGPPWGYIMVGVVLGGVLLIARVPVVYLTTLGGGFEKVEQKLATICMPRGMAAGVLATLPVAAGIAGTGRLPVAIFACVFTTIATFAIAFPLLRRGVPAAEESAPATEPRAPAALAAAAGSPAHAEIPALLTPAAPAPPDAPPLGPPVGAAPAEAPAPSAQASFGPQPVDPAPDPEREDT